MKPTTTRGATHNFQPPSNWQPETDGVCGPLQVRVEPHGPRLHSLVSTWQPSAEELAMLNNGGLVELSIIGSGQPPVAVYAVPRPMGHDQHGPATP